MASGDKEFLIKVRADIQRVARDLQSVASEISATGRASAQSSQQVDGLSRTLDGAASKAARTSKDVRGLARETSSTGKAAGQAARDMKGMSREVTATGHASARSSSQVSGLGRSMAQLKATVAAYISLRTGRELLLQADDYNVLQVRIKTATEATGDYVAISKQLFETSQHNGVALASTVSLFQDLARSAPELDATTGEVLTLVNAVQQLGILSGATKIGMSAGLLQFSQGLAAGVFRAQEFNSLLQNVPGLAVAIAKGMNMTVGELRKAVLEGNLLSKEVFRSLLKQSPEIAAAFEQIPDTVRRSGEALQNSFGKFLSQLDQAYGLTQSIAGFMNKAADALAKAGNPYGDATGLESFDLAIANIEAKIKALRDTRNAGHFSAKATTAALEQEIQLEKLLATLQKQRFDAARRQPFIPDAPGADSAGSSGPPSLTPEQEAATKRNQAAVKALELEAATYGKTAGEIALYKLQLDGATQAQLDRARAALQSTQASDERVRAMQKEIEAEQAATAAADERIKLLRDEGRQVVQDSLTDQERLNAALARYRELLDAGALSQDEFNKAVSAAKNNFAKIQAAGDDAFASLTAATRGWGDDFTNTLADMVTEGKGNFKDLADSIIKDLARIHIQQSITKPALAALGVPGFAGGGQVFGPGSATSDSIPARLSAGEYVVSAAAVRAFGAANLDAINRMRLPRFPATSTIRRPESPRTHFAEGGLVSPGTTQQGSLSVNITNKGQPVQATDARASFDLKGEVISIMLEDLRDNGRYVASLDGSRGLRRTPR